MSNKANLTGERMTTNSAFSVEIERAFAGADRSLLNAMSAAFGLVACSDQVLEQVETSRFLALAKETEALKAIPWEQVETAFREWTQRLLQEGETGREEALKAVSVVHASEAYRKLVLGSARIALISNFKVQDMEEKALSEIAEALGLDPAQA